FDTLSLHDALPILFRGGGEGEGVGWGHGCILLPMENADSVWRSYIRCALSESCRSTLRHGCSLLQLILAFCPHINDRLKSVGGSFPHLRGTLDSAGLDGVLRRFIPAPAGNTSIQVITALLPAVHPRTCGEHLGAVSFSGYRHGSSPHLRGTLERRLGGGARQRFIPAPAGNTAAWPTSGRMKS